jgi:hypothetical protein
MFRNSIIASSILENYLLKHAAILENANIDMDSSDSGFKFDGVPYIC